MEFVQNSPFSARKRNSRLIHRDAVYRFFGLSAGCLGIDLQQKIKVQDDDSYIGTQINNNNEIIG